MPKYNITPSQKRLKELLHYNNKTGNFTWLVTVSNRAMKGSIAGYTGNTIGKNYTSIRIDGKLFRAHRLAWVYVYGHISNTIEIDHIDGNGVNNIINNLRIVTSTGNSKNTRLRIDNKSGVTGVSWDKSRNKWTAQISIQGKQEPLGRFYSFEDAVICRKRAEHENGYHYNHGSIRPL